MAGQPRQIVVGMCRADRGVGIAQHDEIGFPIERQLEPPRCFGAVESGGHAGNAALAEIIAGTSAPSRASKRTASVCVAELRPSDVVGDPHVCETGLTGAMGWHLGTEPVHNGNAKFLP